MTFVDSETRCLLIGGTKYSCLALMERKSAPQEGPWCALKKSKLPTNPYICSTFSVVRDQYSTILRQPSHWFIDCNKLLTIER